MARAGRLLWRCVPPFFVMVLVGSAFWLAPEAVAADSAADVDAAIDAAVRLKGQQRYEEAIAQYLKALEMAPKNATAHNSLAWLLATCPTDRLRDGKQAVAHATKACELSDWKEPYHIGTLSAALAEDGQFDKAIELLNKHREGATATGRWLFDQHLARFRAKKTYHQAEQERLARDAKVNPVAKEVLTGLCRTAMMLEQAHRTDEAVAQYEKAIARAKDVLGKDHVDVGRLLSRLGDVYFNIPKYDRAAACYTEAIAIYHQSLPRSDESVTYAVNNLAGALAMSGHDEEATRLDLENLHVREASLGKNHPHTLLSLHNLGLTYRSTDHAKEAISTLETWLKTDPRACPEKWPQFPLVMGNLGSSYIALRQLDKAEGYCLRALEIVDGRRNDDPEKIRFLQYLTQLYSLTGESGIDNAKKYGERCLKVCREHFGPEHAETAKTMELLGIAYHNAARYAEAVPLLRESMRIEKKIGGNNSAEALNTVGYLAKAEIETGQIAEAEELLLSVLPELETRFAKGQPFQVLEIVPALLAEIGRRKGDQQQIERQLKEMIAAVEVKTGKDDPAVARTLLLAACVYDSYGTPTQSRECAERALSIQRKRLAANDLVLADTLTYLGLLTARLAQYADSESYCRECLEIRRKKLGEEHRLIAKSLCDLGFVYFRMQRYREAETTLRRAIAIAEKAGSEANSPLAESLGHLGRLYTTQHKDADAESCLKRGLELTRQVSGERSCDYGTSLNFLAQFYASAHRFNEAETTYRRALDVFHKINGTNTTSPAVSLSGLGGVLLALGRTKEADEVLRQSLRGFDEHKRGNDRDRYITLNLLIDGCVKAQRWEEAVEHCTESRQAGRRWLSHVLPAMAPNEQLVYLFQEEKLPLYLYLSIAMKCGEKAKAAEASAEWLLNSKATGAECLAEQMQLARQSSDPNVKQTLRDLAAVREELASLVLHSGTDSATKLQAKQTALSQKERDLSRKLGLQTKAGNRGETWTTLADVRKALRPRSVLIEIYRFPLLDFDARRLFSPPTKHYVAWVIPPAGSGKVRMVDLGDAETIDAAVAKSRLAIISAPATILKVGVRRAGQQIEGATGYLADRVYKPLEEAIGNASTLLVSPDAGLWLFPWEALPVGDGKFLVERKQIEYLVTGRTVLNKSSGASGRGAVLFGDPDYDMQASLADTSTPGSWSEFGRRLLGTDKDTGLLAGARFERIPAEGEWIDTLIAPLQSYVKTAPTVYRRKQALESTFKALHGPRVLILATHGYFLRDQLFDKLPQTPEGRRAVDSMNRARLFDFIRDQVAFVPEPLLRCGLALAGANQHHRFRGANDGILTGLEILGTDLHGTELVVLDACETGVGAVRDGEGTAGLHQAFHLAGARVVVASLWSIPAKPSNQLLKFFFTNLAKGETTAASLRKAQLSMIAELRQKLGVAHPLLWAAFTMTDACR